MLERLQKIISAAGVTSRRAAEELISEGRVRVNGKVVTEPGTKADASKDHIKVDGKLINPRQPLTYIMLNKPAGYVTTMSDPEGRPTVQDLMKGVKVRVYPVGRLDYNTEGMLILTNDGDFAHVVTHPRHELPKTYLAKIKGILDDKAIESLETGVFLDDGKTAPAKVKKVRKEEANSWVEITIHEGRKRQVRRMFDRVGRSVIKLKRIRTGNLLLGDLPEGSFRYLTHEEVQGLKEMSQETGMKMPTDKRREMREGRPEAREGRRETVDRIKTGPGSGVKVQVAMGREERQPTSVRRPKTVHKGKPDVRPWRAAERGEESRREPRDAGRRPSFGPRKDSGSRPAFKTSTSSAVTRPATNRPSKGAAPWKSGAGKKPGVRPWKAAERSVESRRGTTYERQETGGRGPKRTYGSQRAEGRGTGTSTRGPAKAGSWSPRKTDAGKKPDVRPWRTATSGDDSRRETKGGQRYGAQTSGGKTGASRSSGFGSGPQSEGRRPSSGPRPNRGNRPRPIGKSPGGGAKFGGRGAGRKR